MSTDMPLHFSKALSDPMKQAIIKALAGPYHRVERVAAGGQVAWLKRAEKLSLRWRLQKGDAARALEAERAGLAAMADLGLPVAQLVVEGPGVLATLDVGPPLTDLLQGGADQAGGFDAAQQAVAFASVGRGLAAFHKAGVTHGRPKIRDICWDGTQARFIDLERYRPGQMSARAMALDVVILLHSILVATGQAGAPFQIAAQSWLAEAPPEAITALRGQLPRLRRMAWYGRQILKLRPNSREVQAAAKLHKALLTLL